MQSAPTLDDISLDITQAIIREISGDLSEYDHLRITKEKEIPQPEPVIRIGEAAFASPGNISVISAAAKAGKTAFENILIAGALACGDYEGLPDVFVTQAIGKAVVQIDTEQSEADHQDNVNTILKRISAIKTPDNFLAYNIRQLSFSEYKSTTSKICQLASQKFGGIHLIVIDGGADFIESVNDEAAASGIIQYFTHLAIKHECPVIVIVHLNPGSEKERGHFGSEIQRKCYGLVSIKKDGDISTIEPKLLRKAGLDDVPLVSFAYSKAKGYHSSIETPEKNTTTDDRKRKESLEIAKKVFPATGSLTYTQVWGKIMDLTSKGERTAKNMIKDMVGWNQIEKGVDGNYRLVQIVQLHPIALSAKCKGAYI